MSPLLPLLPLLCLCFVEQSSVLLGCEHWGLHGHSLFTCVDSLICMGIYMYIYIAPPMEPVFGGWLSTAKCSGAMNLV